jgi:hypothetical protein
MTAPTHSSFRLTLISSPAIQGLFGLLSGAALLVSLLDAGGGLALVFNTAVCLLAGLVFALLALAVRAEWLGVLTAQRLGVAVLAALLLGGLQQMSCTPWPRRRCGCCS